jgi:Cu(I)/Ag(I) efflux system membrane protein CusA/SilA
MIVGLIRWSIANRFLVLIATGFVALAGLYALRETPVDALPDLSDVQVIIKTSFPGQAPQVVEDQVTYPLTSAIRMFTSSSRTARIFTGRGHGYSNT